jgi:hypothetical protein
MGLADGKPTSMATFKDEQRAKLAEIAVQLNPNKLKGSQVVEALRNFGISKLDADLVVDCVNMHKACTWQNTDEVTPDAVLKAQQFLEENKLGITVLVSDARFGKWIWETKLRH